MRKGNFQIKRYMHNEKDLLGATQNQALFLIAETGTNMQRKLFHLYVNFAIKKIERSVLKEELETCRLNPLYGSFILHGDLGKKGEV